MRSMHNQLIYVAHETYAIGQSKHNAPAHERHDGRSYSYASYNNKQDVARQFGRWLEQKHPELQQARDINASHYNEYLRDKAAEGCRDTTLTAYRSCLRSLDRQMQRMWHKEPSDRQILPVQSHIPQSRTQTMTPEHVAQLRASYPDRWSTGAVAVDLGRIAGLRACEMSRLRGSDIRILSQDRAEVQITRSKGGRDRTIEVQGHDRVDRLSELQQHYRDGRVCPIKAQSIEQNISRHLVQLQLKERYPDTSIHCLRKSWAQERYNVYRQDHSKRDTVRYVNDQLGHGRDRDEKLLSKYVSDIH